MSAHLAIPAWRGRTREIPLAGAPAAIGSTVVLGWRAGRTVELNLAGAGPAYVDDLLNAVLDVRSAPEATS